MLAQILHRQVAAELVQGVLRRRGSNGVELNQQIAVESARHVRADGEIDTPFQQEFVGAAEYRFVELDAGIGNLVAETGQRLQQQPGRKHDLHRETQLGLPAPRQRTGGLFHAGRFVEQGAATSVQQLSGFSQHRTPPENLEQAQLQHLLDLLHGIAHAGLGLVQIRTGLGVAAFVDHRDKGAPLVETDSGPAHNQSIRCISAKICAFLSCGAIV